MAVKPDKLFVYSLDLLNTQNTDYLGKQVFPSCSKIPQRCLHWLFSLHECLPYSGYTYQGG